MNFAAARSIVVGVASGTGVIIMAADEVTSEGNIIRDNKNVGIVITDHSKAANMALDHEAEPYSDRFAILNNFMSNNVHEPFFV